MGLERKKAIYDVCVDYGAVPSSRQALFRLDFLGSEKYIIIAEDDQYFFLQVQSRNARRRRQTTTTLRASFEVLFYLPPN
jgi:hypothetical protein